MRMLLLHFAFDFGSLIAIPMKPEEIHELLHNSNRPQIAHTDPDVQKKRQDRLKLVDRLLRRRLVRFAERS